MPKVQLTVCKNQTIEKAKTIQKHRYFDHSRETIDDMLYSHRSQHAHVKHVDCISTKDLALQHRPIPFTTEGFFVFCSEVGVLLCIDRLYVILNDMTLFGFFCCACTDFVSKMDFSLLCVPIRVHIKYKRIVYYLKENAELFYMNN